ncbi:MAG: 4-alpha-glucanotransferase [Acidobacteriaceae bacterium]
MSFDRASGLLLHITSLPSNGGIGDLGPAAYAFADFLEAGKQRLWQVLPLSPTGYGNSPYAALSAFAGNPLLISLEFLADRGWIEPDRLAAVPGSSASVDFDAVVASKMPLLEEAALNFLHKHDEATWARYEAYTRTNWTWLEAYALYSVLKRQFHGAAWNTWPTELARRNPQALDQLRRNHAEDIAVQQILQFAFDDQWSALHAYCAQRGIKLIGDIAIFVNYDSADVWTRPDLFDLDENLLPIRVAGVPPDYFSATGQRWGNPLYRWDAMRRNGFDWWIDRMRRERYFYDIIRLDHFRGFEAYWAIPSANETAEHGEWIKAPGAEFLESISRALGGLPFIAEDLGLITPEVDALRERFCLPGMRVVQFGFGSRKAHDHLPHRYAKNSAVYTGTHDNNTTQGWWDEEATKAEKAAAKAYLGATRQNIVWAMIRAVETSVADICIVPVQDILALPAKARMNMPSRADGNWSWRCPEGALTAALAEKLAALAEACDRDQPPEQG